MCQATWPRGSSEKMKLFLHYSVAHWLPGSCRAVSVVAWPSIQCVHDKVRMLGIHTLNPCDIFAHIIQGYPAENEAITPSKLVLAGVQDCVHDALIWKQFEFTMCSITLTQSTHTNSNNTQVKQSQTHGKHTMLTTSTQKLTLALSFFHWWTCSCEPISCNECCCLLYDIR